MFYISACTWASNEIPSSVSLMHILIHHGDQRSDVYRIVFQVLWFGNKVGQPHGQRTTPTYVYPRELITVVRQRFPDANAGARDVEFQDNGNNAYTVTWKDIAEAKWPGPPKSCKKCGLADMKPYWVTRTLVQMIMLTYSNAAKAMWLKPWNSVLYD